MTDQPASLASALQSSREGMLKAVELGKEAARRRAKGEKLPGSADGERADTMQQKASVVQDMVLLSTAAKEAKASAAVIQVVDENTAELLGLGAKLDVKA